MVESNVNSNAGEVFSGGNEADFLTEVDAGAHVPGTKSEEPCVSCTTFNILAPIYKRLDQERFTCVINWGMWNRTKTFVKAISEHSGSPGIRKFWIGCFMKNLPLYAYRSSLGWK
ncbi:hypothetical protein K2173_008388 [Erythroxylum novogranatense]|uniref:Uncharacterized protein n=1 Tax=Erythroxylum novogranatense TaxID=1862640 RepID=A0AAV8TL19_9ROSI|nr:hypothetical protein K2173_008388 [Erythroxylum novogranatense]